MRPFSEWYLDYNVSTFRLSAMSLARPNVFHGLFLNGEMLIHPDAAVPRGGLGKQAHFHSGFHGQMEVPRII